MRITSVTAHAFGPLVGATLEPADGLTVIVGGNEAAKSSWHAAVYSALCGRRRGAGTPGPADTRFADLHKPWDREDWKVSARLTLDDGTVLDVVQDLAGKVNCRIVELPLGTDRSNELTYDGSVDASLLLGLNRKAFAATACVAQADLLKILENAAALQDMLSKAATSADADASTAKALALIDKYSSEHVGLDRANSVRPLRAALDRLEAAETALRDARAARAELETRVAGSARLAQAATDAHTDHAYANAALLAARATDLEAIAARAAELAAGLGPDTPTTAGAQTVHLEALTRAVTQWRSRPNPGTAPEDPEEIRRALDGLPGMPDHDTAPVQAAKTAAGTYQRLSGALEAHDGKPERTTLAAPVTGPSSEQLRALARDLSTLASPAPAPAPSPAPAPVTVTTPANRTPGIVVAVLGALAAVAGFALSVPALTAAGALAVLAGGIWASTRKPTSTTTTPAVTATATVARPVDDSRRTELEARADSYRVALDMPALLAAIQTTEAAETKAAARATWVSQRADLETQLGQAGDDLAAVLSGRGYPCTGATAWNTWGEYEKACTDAADQALRAGRRSALEVRLTTAETAAFRYTAATDAVDDAAKKLRAAVRDAAPVLPATVTAAPTETPEDLDALADALDTWAAGVSAADAAAAAAADARTELASLLGPMSLTDKQTQAVAARADADAAATGLDRDRLAATPIPTPAQVAALAAAAADADGEAREEAGKVAQFAAGLPDVADAEEELADATAELARVRSLNDVLTRTRDFMVKAQERVHRDLAPALQAHLARWLPVVTSGRYTDASVNPKTLQVQVKGASGSWRKAELLSHGTAEQVYLLLRLALVEHLTAGKDTCPLLLDDVTVHADTTRTREILDLLAVVAADRQVILFTQEDMVADWARANMGGTVGKVIELGEPVPA